MRIDLLFTDFDRLTQSSESVHRLRRFILDLAVRGKLVPQDPNDEPASKLLTRMKQTRDNRHKRKLPLIKTNPKKKDFELPDNWSLAPLGVLGAWAIGAGFPKNEQGRTRGPYFFLKVSDMNLPGNERVIVTAQNRIDDEDATRIRAKVHSVRTIIFPKIGGAIATNKRRILGRPSAIDNNCLGITISNEIDLDWAYILLNSLEFTRYQAGTAVPALQQGVLERISIAIPPFPEQRRIVAKVDELTVLCDRLEAARAGREATRNRLATASLTRLNTPTSDPATFQHNVSFALKNLAPLTTRPDQITALRQTILNLAARGKLVPQDPNDESAAELLKRAMIAKGQTAIERKIRKSSEPELSESEGENGSPGHWVWAYLHEFALVLGGKRLPPDASFSPEKTGNIYIRVKDMKDGSISSEDLQYISDDVRAQIAKYTIDREDLYITIAGTIGDVGEVPELFHGQNLTENAAKVVFREVDRKFLLLALRSEDVQEQFREKTKQMAQPKLALKRIAGARIPLPPLAEQHRIVAKIDKLMGLCDQLEVSLVTGDEAHIRVIDVLLKERAEPATGGT